MLTEPSQFSSGSMLVICDNSSALQYTTMSALCEVTSNFMWKSPVCLKSMLHVHGVPVVTSILVITGGKVLLISELL